MPTQADLSFLTVEPSFEDYVAARRVVLYEYNRIRHAKYQGQLSIARDEMLANIIHKSCARYITQEEIKALLSAT